MREFYPELEPEIAMQGRHVQDIPESLPLRLKKRGVDAVICISDHQAIRFMQAAFLAGFKIPDDFLLSGFGGIIDPHLTMPSLTTVEQHFEKMGQIATDMVMGHKRGKNVYVSTSIREGGSSRRKLPKTS